MHKGRVYEYKRLPFGLKVSLAGLSRGLTQMLRKFNSQIQPYIDNLLVMSKTHEEHIKILGELLGVLRDKGVTLNLEKTQFFRTSLDYVGFVLTTDGLKPQESKVDSIKNIPRCMKDLQVVNGAHKLLFPLQSRIY